MSHPTGRRILAGVALVVTCILLGAAPAGAVSPRPTDDRSEVTAVEPAGLTARVIGGDSLVEIVVEPGHEVVVEGYGGEPYLRVLPDGTVQVNQRSAAVSLNRDRDADLANVETTQAGAPDWVRTGGGGRAVWHDHRIHAGSGAELTGPVDWSIPLTVDARPGAIDGRLDRLPSPSPLPALAVAVALAGAVWWAGRRRPRPVATVALLVAGAIATVTGFVEWQSVPDSVGRNPGLVLLPLGAAAAVLVSLVAGRRTVRLVALSLAVALLAGWVAYRWSILHRAVLVSSLAPTVDRVGLAVVLGATLAAAGLIVSWAGTDAAGPLTDPAPSGRRRAGA